MILNAAFLLQLLINQMNGLMIAKMQGKRWSFCLQKSAWEYLVVDYFLYYFDICFLNCELIGIGK
jgi:hypothetical protein